ncbi:MAG: PfkB family carbohydrate kinase [Planctomycetota bacterium]
MATVLTVTANPLLDHLALTPWAPGKVTRLQRIPAIAGGKGINVARVLTRHGHRAVALGFAGGDSGRHMAKLIEADGVTAALTTTAAPLRVGFQVVEPGGRTTALIEDGFAVTKSEADSFLNDLAKRLPADLVIVSGSVPDPTLADLYRHICDLCATAHVPCWIDAYGPAMRAALAGAHPPLLSKPNREEYGSDQKPWLAARELHLTDGSGVVTVRTPDGRFRVVPPSVAEINPIGCGDCYLAALAHARLTGMPLQAQLAYAAAAGAVNAARADVACIGPEDIKPLVGAVLVAPAS